MKLTRTEDDWLDLLDEKPLDRRKQPAAKFEPTPLPPAPDSSLVAIQYRLGWIALAAVLVFAAMCVPFWLGRVYVLDDLGAFHLPIRDFYARQLAAGEPFDWMPSLFCGFYATGEGQMGGYHPLHWLLYRTLPLGTAFNLELLLNFPFMAAGSYLFLRRVVVRRDAAAFGALVFTFSSFNLLHIVHPNAIGVIAHLPWLLWLIDLVISRQSHWAGCAIALLTGSQLLLGYPQYVWFSLMCEAAFAGWQLWRTSGLLSSIGVLAAAKLVGLVLGAAQVLPTIDALGESTRQTVDAAFRNSGSMHPLNLLQLVEPYLFANRVVGGNTHELGLYVGAVPLMLCVWLLLTSRRNLQGNVAIAAAGVFGVMSLVYAFGEYGPLYRWQSLLPVVGNFRFPCRATVLFQLAIAVLTAFAFARLTKPPVTQARGLWIVPMLSVVGVVVACWKWGEHLAHPLLIVTGPLLIAAATFLVMRAQRGQVWATIALVMFAAADLGVYGLTYALQETAELNAFASQEPLPPHLTKGRIAAELPNRGTDARIGNRMLLAGLNRADGYAGLEPVRNLDYGDAAALRRASVSWVRAEATGVWTPIKPLPRVRFAAMPRVKSAAVAESLRVQSLNRKPVVTLDRDRPGAIDVTVQTPIRRTLVVGESYHPGWKASIDGENIPVVLADGDFLGCPVPAGKHEVNLRFEPASLRQGLLLSACGLSFTVGWGAIALRRSMAVRFAKPSIVHIKR